MYATPSDCIDLPTCTFANILLGMSWSSAGAALDLTNHFLLWKSLKALKGVEPNTIKCHLICTKKDSNERDQWCSYQLYWGHNICELLQKSGKGQIIIDQVRPPLGSVSWLVDWLWLCSKLPYFRLFQHDTQILSALAALYWPSTTKYWTIPPHSDPVPPSTNYYSPILTHYHQAPHTSAQFTAPGLVYTFLHTIEVIFCLLKKKIMNAVQNYLADFAEKIR